MELTFRVPYALDTHGNVVTALTADPRSTFTCLECGDPVRRRRAERRRWHFFHLPGSTCSGESVQHLAAKRILRAQLRDELRDFGAVRWMRRCPGVHGECRDASLIPSSRPLPRWTDVREEVRSSTYVLDVAVVDGDAAVFGVEVMHTHAVPPEKASALTVPWIEVRAEDVLEGRPRIPLRDSIASERCAACEELVVLLAERAATDAKRRATESEYAIERELFVRRWSAVMSRARGSS